MPAVTEVDEPAVARGADDSRALMAYEYDYNTHGALAFFGGLILAVGGFVLAA